MLCANILSFCRRQHVSVASTFLMLALIIFGIPLDNILQADPIKSCKLEEKYLIFPKAEVQCLHDNGFPYSRVEKVYDLSNEEYFSIDTGPRVKFGKIEFEDWKYNWHVDQLVNFYSGQAFSKSKVQELLLSLEAHNLLTDPTVEAVPNNENNVSIKIKGEKPTSSLSFGAEFDGTSNYLRLRGQHFVTTPIPGYVDYYLNRGVETRDYSMSVDVPLLYRFGREVRGNIAILAEDYFKLETKNLGLSFGLPLNSSSFFQNNSFSAGLREYNYDGLDSLYFTFGVNSQFSRGENINAFLSNELQIGLDSSEWQLSTEAQLSHTHFFSPKYFYSSSLTADFDVSSGAIADHQKVFNTSSNLLRGFQPYEIGGIVTVGEGIGLEALAAASFDLGGSKSLFSQDFVYGLHSSLGVGFNEGDNKTFVSKGVFFGLDVGFGQLDLSVSKTNTHNNTVIQLNLIDNF